MRTHRDATETFRKTCLGEMESGCDPNEKRCPPNAEGGKKVVASCAEWVPLGRTSIWRKPYYDGRHCRNGCSHGQRTERTAAEQMKEAKAKMRLSRTVACPHLFEA